MKQSDTLNYLKTFKYEYKVNPDGSCTVKRAGILCAIIDQGIQKAKKIFETK